MYLSQLAIYPLKSAAGIRLDEAIATPLGLEWDRRWLLVDEQGLFVTQRQQAQMALIRVTVEQGILVANAPDMPTLVATPNMPEPITVRVWEDDIVAQTVSAAADAWFSQFLARSVRLVFFPEHLQRPVDKDWAGDGHFTAFSDGFPYLVITQASLDALSQAWGQELAWQRFRPNLVIAGTIPPFAEDEWHSIRINGMDFALVKPCSRCVIPSIDPSTGEKDRSVLTLLQQQRKRADGRVYLGQNAIMQSSTGMLRVGMAVQWLA